MTMYFYPVEKIASRIVVGEAILVKLPVGEMTVLSESATVLWSGIDGTRSEVDLAQHLRAAYALPELPYIGEFLNDLKERDLVYTSDTAKSAPAPNPNPSVAPELLTTYAPPAVKVAEAIETLAGVCDSSWGGFSSCQTFGVCLDPFE